MVARGGPSSVGAGRGGRQRAPDSPPRSEAGGLLSPADVGGLGGGDALDAVGRLVRDELDAGVVAVQPRRVRRLLAGLGAVNDGLDAQFGHLDRVLLSRGADDAGLDVFFS